MAAMTRSSSPKRSLRVTGFDQLANARQTVADAATGLVDDQRVADVQFVVSELLTNAIEHGAGDESVISFGPSEGSFVITVKSSAIPPLDPFEAALTEPPVTVPAGRGLRIVHAVSDDLDIVTTPDGSVSVTAKFFLPARS